MKCRSRRPCKRWSRGTWSSAMTTRRSRRRSLTCCWSRWIKISRTWWMRRRTLQLSIRSTKWTKWTTGLRARLGLPGEMTMKSAANLAQLRTWARWCLDQLLVPLNHLQAQHPCLLGQERAYNLVAKAQLWANMGSKRGSTRPSRHEISLRLSRWKTWQSRRPSPPKKTTPVWIWPQSWSYTRGKSLTREVLQPILFLKTVKKLMRL